MPIRCRFSALTQVPKWQNLTANIATIPETLDASTMIKAAHATRFGHFLPPDRHWLAAGEIDLGLIVTH